jgi:adenylate kinase
VCTHCGGKVMQRTDDTPDGIAKRLEVFQAETLPMVEFYRKKGLVVEIDGDHSIEQVFNDIVHSLDI